jgi:hypothetical protein
MTGGSMDPFAPVDEAFAMGMEDLGLVTVAVPPSAEALDPLETMLALLALAAVGLLIDSDRAERIVYGGLGLMVVIDAVEARAPDGRGAVVVGLAPMGDLRSAGSLSVVVVLEVDLGFTVPVAEGTVPGRGVGTVEVGLGMVVDLPKTEEGLVAVLAVLAAMLARPVGFAGVGLAEGTGGLVVTLVRAGGDLGLGSTTLSVTALQTGERRDSLPNTPDLRTFLTPSIFCPIFPSFPKVLFALFSLSLPFALVD